MGIFSIKIWSNSRVGNLKADPSYKKIYSEFSHNCPKVPQPHDILEEAYILETEIKYLGCRAHPEV